MDNSVISYLVTSVRVHGLGEALGFSQCCSVLGHIMLHCTGLIAGMPGKIILIQRTAEAFH